ncbi:unnamed protein product, partial [Amoebophrya sp. A120]
GPSPVSIVTTPSGADLVTSAWGPGPLAYGHHCPGARTGLGQLFQSLKRRNITREKYVRDNRSQDLHILLHPPSAPGSEIGAAVNNFHHFSTKATTTHNEDRHDSKITPVAASCVPVPSFFFYHPRVGR